MRRHTALGTDGRVGSKFGVSIEKESGSSSKSYDHRPGGWGHHLDAIGNGLGFEVWRAEV